MWKEALENKLRQLSEQDFVTTEEIHSVIAQAVAEPMVYKTSARVSEVCAHAYRIVSLYGWWNLKNAMDIALPGLALCEEIEAAYETDGGLEKALAI